MVAVRREPVSLAVDELVSLSGALEVPFPASLVPDIGLADREQRHVRGRRSVLERGLVRETSSGFEMDEMIAQCLELTNRPAMVSALLMARGRFEATWLFTSPAVTASFTRLGSAGDQRVELWPTSDYVPEVCDRGGLDPGSLPGSATIVLEASDQEADSHGTAMSALDGMTCGTLATFYPVRDERHHQWVGLLGVRRERSVVRHGPDRQHGGAEARLGGRPRRPGPRLAPTRRPSAGVAAAGLSGRPRPCGGSTRGVIPIATGTRPGQPRENHQ